MQGNFPDGLSNDELHMLEEQYGSAEDVTLSGSLTQPIPALRVPPDEAIASQAPMRYEGQATGIPSMADLRRLSEHIRSTRPPKPR